MAKSLWSPWASHPHVGLHPKFWQKVGNTNVYRMLLYAVAFQFTETKDLVEISQPCYLQNPGESLTKRVEVVITAVTGCSKSPCECVVRCSQTFHYITYMYEWVRKNERKKWAIRNLEKNILSEVKWMPNLLCFFTACHSSFPIKEFHLLLIIIIMKHILNKF